jgi:hypothetical protein
MDNERELQTLKIQNLFNGIMGAQFGAYFPFPTKAPTIRNSCTNVIPKVGAHLGIIGFHPLNSPPFVKMCFTPQHTFDLMAFGFHILS